MGGNKASLDKEKREKGKTGEGEEKGKVFRPWPRRYPRRSGRSRSGKSLQMREKRVSDCNEKVEEEE